MARNLLAERGLSKKPRNLLRERGYKSQEIQPEEGFFEKLPRNVAQGIFESLRQVVNLPHKLHLQDKEPLPKTIPLPFGGEVASPNPANLLGQKGEGTLSDRLIQGLAQYAPAFALPGVNLGKAGEGIASIPKVGGFLSRTASQAIPQALFGATQNEDPLKGAEEGALGAVAGNVLSEGLGKAINALKPSRLLRGKLTPAELEKNLESIKGTETNLGRVIEHPGLMRLFENYLPHVIGSGAENSLERTADKIIGKGHSLIEKIKGPLSENNLGMQIKDALKLASAEATHEKNSNFRALDKEADKLGLKIERQNFKNKAKEKLQDINKSSELEREFDKNFLKDIKQYSTNEKGNNLKLSNIFKGKLNDKANEFYENGKTYEYGLMKDLKNALQKDVDEGIESSGSHELKDLYNTAQKEYQEKFAPFDDPDIVKFTRRGGDPDLILPHFLKGGQNDRAYLLQKLQSKLNKGGSSDKLLAYSHFSKALDDHGKVNPIKFSSLYHKLGKNQKEILLPDPVLRKELDNFSNLVQKNKEAFHLMFNPHTGKRNQILLSKMGELLGAALTGSLPHAAASLGALSAVGRLSKKALTSEKLREKLIHAMINPKETKVSNKLLTPLTSNFLESRDRQ